MAPHRRTVPPAHPEPAPGHRPRSGGERLRAFEAGRAFRRFRVWYGATVLAYCDADLATLRDVLLPELTGHVAAMGRAAADGRADQLGQALSDKLAHLGTDPHREWLESEAVRLNELAGPDRWGFDLAAHRARHLVSDFDWFDGRVREVLAGLPDPIAAAFRLGECLERGVFPNGPPAEPEPEPSPFTDGWPTGPRVERRLELADPRVPGDRPWDAGWLRRLTDAWAAAGLPPTVVTAVISERTACATPAERMAAVAAFAAAAVERLGRGVDAAVPVADRLRVLDDGAMQVALDGRTFVIEWRGAFEVLKALLAAPGLTADTRDLQRLPGCRGDLSKVVSKLPDELRQLVVGRTGHGSYSLRLPVVPEP